MGDRKISIRTSVLEEKATACNMLCCYADELKDGFYPYVEQVRCIEEKAAWLPAGHSSRPEEVGACCVARALLLVALLAGMPHYLLSMN